MTTLPVPVKIFEQHMIALGKTGAGKSSAIRDLVEYLLDKDERVIVVTPKADWWGLKLAADGKGPGYPVVVFGGDHADMPLHHLSGRTMAELLATGNRSAVLQMRDFMPGERTQFWIDFASHLFRLLRGKLYLVIDEVHNFAPKGRVLDAKAGMMLHWSNKLASEARGLGITLIGASQRPQKVHNDFLTSCETLIAMRVTTSWDRDAVKDWIDGCGDAEQGKAVLNTLAGMKRGDAWVWSPEVEFGPKQVHFPMFKTYDSFRPQKPDEVEKLKGWAEIDLDDVKKKLETVVKDAEAKDPARLKVRIAELEKQLRQRPTGTKEIQVADPKAIERAVRPYRGALEDVMKVLVKVTAVGFDKAGIKPEEVKAALDAAATNISKLAEKQLESRKAEFDRLKMDTHKLLGRLNALLQKENVQVEVSVRHNEPFTLQPSSPRHARVASKAEFNGDMSGPEKKIMQALAELASISIFEPSTEQVAAWAGYSAVGGAFGNPKGALRSKGLIDYPSPGIIMLTQEGRKAVGNVDAPSQAEFYSRLENTLSGPEWKILKVLLDRGAADPIDKDELAAKAGYSPIGGAFGNPVGALRTRGLIDYPRSGVVKASEWLFTL